MKRRSFIKQASILSAPFFVGGIQVSSFSKSRFTQMFNPEDDRVLVLIQLNGGNDGLNTVIPLDQYGKLYEVRDNIIIPENKIVKIEDNVGFHPSFSPMKDLYNENKLSIIQGVAYPNQNRSHFRSLDIWQTASEANEFLSSGWMGRYLDTEYSGYPTDYPNDDTPDPIAITIGFQLSETCQGLGANYSIALSSEDSLQGIDSTGTNLYEEPCYAEQVTFIKDSIIQLNAYSEVVNAAFERGENRVEYPQDRFAEQLRLIAKLISGGLGTKVYVANLGGFDTHANQVDQSDVTVGEHADLLSRLSEGIHAFQKDMEAQSLEERVIGMTYSEFGRRIRSNGSFGSDHGTAAPMFVFGSCASAGIIGDNPQFPEEIQNSDGVELQYDFRSVYGSILMDWFGAKETDIQSILFEDFTYIPIVTQCLSTSTEEIAQNEIDIKAYPNPTRDYIRIKSDITEDLHYELYDTRGTKLLLKDNLYGGKETEINLSRLPSGTYFLRIGNQRNGTIKKIVKI